MASYPSSIRVNLSVPRQVDAVLTGLAEATGASKASFVMQALLWYLPELRGKLAQFNAQKGASEPLERVDKRLLPPALPEVKLTRAERRRAERENKKR